MISIQSFPNYVYGWQDTNFLVTSRGGVTTGGVTVDHTLEDIGVIPYNFQYSYRLVTVPTNGTAVTNLTTATTNVNSVTTSGQVMIISTLGDVPYTDSRILENSVGSPVLTVAVTERDQPGNLIGDYFGLNNLRLEYGRTEVIVTGYNGRYPYLNPKTNVYYKDGKITVINVSAPGSYGPDSEKIFYYDAKITVNNLIVPAEPVTQPVRRTNFAQAPDPFIIKVDDFSQELFYSTDGNIDQITEGNDPRLVSVQVPNFIEGQTGQPKQLWF